MEDDVLSILGSIGYRGITSRDTLSSKDKLIRYIIYVVCLSQLDKLKGIFNILPFLPVFKLYQ